MNDSRAILLIIDYNLTRVSDVKNIASYARERHDADTILIRANPTERDFQLCDCLIDLDPLADDFVERALVLLKPWRKNIRAGIVFSDDAVQTGAELLERLSLPVDSAALAVNAYSKRAYRGSEAHIRELLEGQQMFVPDFVEVFSVDDLRRFAANHPGSFVVKPSCEGNNRGVVIVRPGDDLEAAFAAVSTYLARGAICETLIPFDREYSFDGIGATEFITEKVTAYGRYPVEVAQILPAQITATERTTLTRAGRLANVLVGQHHGPFHNEIKLDDAGQRAAIVEPNRRPAGMKIWTIARHVYDTDFYRLWVDAAFGKVHEPRLDAATRRAATVMLGVPVDGMLRQPSQMEGELMFERTLTRAAALLEADSLRSIEFGWLGVGERFIPGLPRDNADFAAQACFCVNSDALDMRAAVATVRAIWLAVLAETPGAFEACAASPLALTTA